MKANTTIVGFCLFSGLVIAAALVLAHHRAATIPRPLEQVFHVNGVIRSLEVNEKRVVIEHEDIPGFMPGMTMPFAVKQPALLRGLSPGEPVRFDLVVTRDDSWVSGIEPRSGTAPGQLKASAPGLSRSGGIQPEALTNGQRVPDFELTDENAHQVHLHDFQGKVVLVTFVYTRCPLPNYCPLMSRNFASLQQRLGKEFPGRFHLVTISFDPEHDTPEVLKHYAEAFTQDESTWSFATGTPQQIQQLGGEFGLAYFPEAGSLTHDLRTALIAPDGRLVHIWRSNVWTPYEVQRRVREVLAPEAAARFTSAGYESHPQAQR